MTRAASVFRGCLAYGLAVLVSGAVALSLLAAPAFADTSATCTTDTATSYCEQLPAGTNASGAMDGFVLVEATSGVLFTFLTGWWIYRKLLGSAGWGT